MPLHDLSTHARAAQAVGLRRVRGLARAAPLPARVLAWSWLLGAHGVALLPAWATSGAPHGLTGGCTTLRVWKARRIRRLRAAGWRVQPRDANFFVAARACLSSAGGLFDMQSSLTGCRRGVNLRDCASLGLPGHLRMAQAPRSAGAP